MISFVQSFCNIAHIPPSPCKIISSDLEKQFKFKKKNQFFYMLFVKNWKINVLHKCLRSLFQKCLFLKYRFIKVLEQI